MLKYKCIYNSSFNSAVHQTLENDAVFISILSVIFTVKNVLFINLKCASDGKNVNWKFSVCVCVCFDSEVIYTHVFENLYDLISSVEHKIFWRMSQ